MILLLSHAYSAEPAPPPPAPPPFANHGELRLIGSLPPAELVVDVDGHTLGQGPVLDSRLRDTSTFSFGTFQANVEFDVFDAQIAGDPWDIAGTEDARHRESVSPIGPGWWSLRKLSLGGRVGPVQVEGGVTTSQWGLGMIANDGAHDPEFGRADFGDRVLRLRAGTRPIKGVPLTFALAGDRVLEDDNTTWDVLEGTGAAAWQGIATVTYGEKDAARVGIYGVYRDQMEADAVRWTRVGVADVYADVPLEVGLGTLRLAEEAAVIGGRTSRGQSYASPSGLDVLSGAVTGLAELKLHFVPLRVAARGGWASGDADPNDDQSEDFAFDRDFDVGMVLFDEVQGAIDAATYAELSNAENAGQAPDGADALVAEGAARHTAFVQPIVEVTPLPWLAVKVGATAAWNTRAIEEPYATFRAGGVPSNQLGQPTTGYALGTELDWAVRVGDVPLPGSVGARPALLVQGGHAFLSADMGGGTVTLVSAAARLRW